VTLFGLVFLFAIVVEATIQTSLLIFLFAVRVRELSHRASPNFNQSEQFVAIHYQPSRARGFLYHKMLREGKSSPFVVFSEGVSKNGVSDSIKRRELENNFLAEATRPATSVNLRGWMCQGTLALLLHLITIDKQRAANYPLLDGNSRACEPDGLFNLNTKPLNASKMKY
jgi:hypothetical protein